MKKGLLILVAIFGLLIFGQNVLAADWQTSTLDTGNVGVMNAVAVDNNGYVHIAYYDTANADLKYITNESGTWVATTIDSVGNVGLGISIKMDSNNKAHIAYIDYTSSNLKYASNSSGSWVVTTIDNSGTISVGLFQANITSLGLDSNNKAYISYYDSTNLDLKYITNVSGSWVIITIDSNGNVGEYSSLALDSNNNVHIGYYDVTNTALKYATNSLSGAWSVSTIDNSNSVGAFMSLAIGNNDKIHISYLDATNADLKYITNSSGVWVATSLDTSNQSGYDTFIGVDSDNAVRIVYYELTSLTLKYATNFSGQWTYTTLDTSGNFALAILLGYYNQFSLFLDSNNKTHVSYFKTPTDLKYTYTPGPTVSSTSINSGRSYSAYRNISIESSLTGSPTEMIVSEKSDFVGASWETYNADKIFRLSSEKGNKTIYLKFRDSWHAETAVVSQAIKYVGNPKFVTKKATKTDEVKVKTKNTKYYGKDYYLNFKKYPTKFKSTKRYFLAERQKKYTKLYANAKNNLLKKYWKVTTDFNKYKSNKQTRLKLVFEYTTAEFKVLKKKVKGLKEKDLYLKYYNSESKEWADLQVAPNTTDHTFTIYLNSLFNFSERYYVIGR